MKKCLFCLVFVLCVVLCAVACAESPCSYCLEKTGVDECEYTLKVETEEGFALYIPADFHSVIDHFYLSQEAEISWFTSMHPLEESDGYDASYEDPETWFMRWSAHSKARIFNGFYAFRGHIVAILDTWLPFRNTLFQPEESEGHQSTILYISNGETWFEITIKAATPERTSELTDGILAHIVMPEQSTNENEYAQSAEPNGSSDNVLKSLRQSVLSLSPENEYTQPVELDGFTVYIPAEFYKEHNQSGYLLDDALISINDWRYLSEDGDAYYEDLDEWRQYYEYRFANLYDDDDTVRRVLYIDDLAALSMLSPMKGPVRFSRNKEIDEHILLNLYITNGEKWLTVSIETETPETAEQLAEGIARHVVLTNTAE